MKVDSHSHSIFSADGSVEIEKMLNNALREGGSYLAITDHLDLDALVDGNTVPVPWSQLNLDAYKTGFKKAKEQVPSNFYLAFGVETGFEEKASDGYKKIIANNDFDVVINSVHFVGGYDVYFPYFFEGRSKEEAYLTYLKKVRQSLEVNYHFDIVGHIGYCVRNAPYADPIMHYYEQKEVLDEILKRIIELGKTLEVNTHHVLCPNTEILKRYYELGGRKISFGSDAHKGDVFKDYDKAVLALKDIGFSGFNYFIKHKENFAKFD